MPTAGIMPPPRLPHDLRESLTRFENATSQCVDATASCLTEYFTIKQAFQKRLLQITDYLSDTVYHAVAIAHTTVDHPAHAVEKLAGSLWQLNLGTLGETFGDDGLMSRELLLGLAGFAQRAAERDIIWPQALASLAKARDAHRGKRLWAPQDIHVAMSDLGLLPVPKPKRRSKSKADNVHTMASAKRAQPSRDAHNYQEPMPPDSPSSIELARSYEDDDKSIPDEDGFQIYFGGDEHDINGASNSGDNKDCTDTSVPLFFGREVTPARYTENPRANSLRRHRRTSSAPTCSRVGTKTSPTVQSSLFLDDHCLLFNEHINPFSAPMGTLVGTKTSPTARSSLLLSDLHLLPKPIHNRASQLLPPTPLASATLASTASTSMFRQVQQKAKSSETLQQRSETQKCALTRLWQEVDAACNDFQALHTGFESELKKVLLGLHLPVHT